MNKSIVSLIAAAAGLAGAAAHVALSVAGVYTVQNIVSVPREPQSDLQVGDRSDGSDPYQHTDA